MIEDKMVNDAEAEQAFRDREPMEWLAGRDDPYEDLLKYAPTQLAHTAAIAYGRWLRDQEPPDTTRWGYPVE
jgi:hypothetical protein